MPRAGSRTLALATVVASASLCVAPAAATSTPVFEVAETVGLTVAVLPGDVTLEADGGGDPTYDPNAAQVLTGALPLTTVTDVRAAGGAFVVTVSGTAFTHADDGGITVPTSAVRVYLDAVDLPSLETELLGLGLLGATIDGAALAADAPDLSSSYTLLSGTTGLLGGTIPYVPTIEVTIPAATPAGTYSAVITQTVS